MDNKNPSQPQRKRARGMNVEERRAMIVQAALPLLAEAGPSVTTLQIARAAGVSEPTIFRAFTDKNEVLAACLEEVLKPDRLVIELEAIAHQPGLDERLSQLIEVIRAQSERTGTVLNAIRLAASPSKQAAPGQHADNRRKRWLETHAIIHAKVTEVLKPDEAQLRLPAADLATMVLAIVLPLGRTGSLNAGLAQISTKQLADLILHGVMK